MCAPFSLYKSLIASTAIFIYCIPPRFLLSPHIFMTRILNRTTHRFVYYQGKTAPIEENLILFSPILSYDHIKVQLNFDWYQLEVCGFNSRPVPIRWSFTALHLNI